MVDLGNTRHLPYPYGMLGAEVRRLIGLRRYSTATTDEIADLLDMDCRKLRELWRAIHASLEGRTVLKGGLPAMYGEALFDDAAVQCRNCRRWVNWVPCVTCCDHRIEFSDRNDRLRWMSGDTQPPTPPNQTAHLPGSPEKVEVMRSRLSAGYHLYHDRDTRF